MARTGGGSGGGSKLLTQEGRLETRGWTGGWEYLQLVRVAGGNDRAHWLGEDVGRTHCLPSIHCRGPFAAQSAAVRKGKRAGKQRAGSRPR